MSNEFGKKRGLNNAAPEDPESMIPEAQEDRVIDIEDSTPVDNYDEGEDLMENRDKDYRAIPELDTYENDGVDGQRFSRMDMQDRRQAEREIDERDIRNKNAGSRLPTAMLNETEGSLYSQAHDFNEDLMERRQFHYQELGMDIEGDGLEDDEDFQQFQDVDTMKEKLDQIVDDPKTIRYIKKQFKKFLFEFEENGVKIYRNRISEMCAKNKQSLEITYHHLSREVSTLALWLFDSPKFLIPYLNDVLFDAACKIFPTYESIHSEVYFKIREFPLSESLRDLRTTHLNTMIKVQGVITRRYPVYSQLKKIFYICKCGNRMGPVFQSDISETKLGQCPVCHSNGPFSMDSETTVYRNYQKVTIQESPGSVLPGRVPRHKDVILLGDNIDTARPGDEIEVVGIYTNSFDYSMNVKHGFPVFNTMIEANNIKKVSDINFGHLTRKDKDKIHSYSRKPNIARIIVNSIAPSIYGHHHIKTALALSMFGGEPQNINNSHKIRGDINVLLLGDPGLAKSQFLKYVEQTFHRTVYTTGKGASAVGLTASVRRDFTSREWTLEGGALVLADQGICLIDEFDKMSEIDRTSIHEAMEQQSISISKAGIVATLRARCAVIAAANPIKGRYDRQLSFSDNVNLSDPILSRFDVLCVLKDSVDSTADRDLATFIVNSHIKSHPSYNEAEDSKELLAGVVNSTGGEKMTQDMLKKYILYARKHIHPKLAKGNIDKISNFYSELRRESQMVGGLNIVTRHIESLIRMAQASARIHLRSEVKSEDIDLGISVLLESFIQSQKVSIGKVIKKKFSSYISFREDMNSMLIQVLERLFKEQMHYLEIIKQARVEGHEQKEPSVIVNTLRESAKEMNIYDVQPFLDSKQFKSIFNIQGDAIFRNGSKLNGPSGP